MDKKNEDLVAKLLKRGFDQDLINIALCREAYSGGTAFINKSNLFTHTREKSDDYIARVSRAYYLNYTAPIVDTYSFFLFKSSINRKYDEKSLILTTFLKNCDNKGTSLDEFMKTVTVSLLQAGREFIVVDMPAVLTETKADELMNNKRPYIYSIKTEDVLDFCKDDEGFVWIKYKTVIDKKEASWDYTGVGKEQRIVIWSRGNYISYDGEGEIQENVNTEIDFVPIIEIKFGDGDSLIKDIARINRALFNWCSLLDEILYQQTFSQLIIPGSDSEKISEKKIGTAWAWTFDKDSKHAPSFISPDVAQAAALETRIANSIAEIYRIANLDWANSSMGAKSGVAKAYDFMNVNKTLSTVAFGLQEGEKKIFKLLAKYYGVDIDVNDDDISNPYDIYIQYPTEFSYSAVQEKLTRLYEALNTGFSTKFLKLVSQDIVDTMFPMLNDDAKGEIAEEIEAFYAEATPEETAAADNAAAVAAIAGQQVTTEVPLDASLPKGTEAAPIEEKK